MHLYVARIITEEETMSSQDTVKKLRQMRLPVIAEQYEIQISDPSYNQLSFEERFNELIDMEYESRVNHTITKYIKDAHFYDSTASIEDINYNPNRKLNRSQMEELATNNYIERGLSIIFVGASGCGKTWLSNALGVHACRNRKTVLYIRLPELFSKFEEKRIQGKYNEYLKRLGKYDLLIIDEFLLKPTNESERSALLELMEIRCNKKSTIFCSQYSFDGWHQLLDGGPIADAILDRIINSSYLITLHGKSLREEYSRIKQ